MTDRARPSLLRRVRARSSRELQGLDAKGYLAGETHPLLLGTLVFGNIMVVGVIMFFVGVQGAGRGTLTAVVIAGFGLAVAVAVALASAQYRSAQQLDEAQGELLAVHGELELERTTRRSIVHDARAVVGAMGAALHALERSGQQREISNAMTSQVERLRELLTAPTSSLRPTSLDELREPIVSFANLHGMALSVDLPLQVHVMADPPSVSTILQNLVDNARKYASGSPVRVFWEPAGTHIRICVEDRGPGMGARPESLFAEGARAGDHEIGTGLGLATARMLAERNEGSLWHERRNGPGSRFVLRLHRAGDPGSEGGTL